MAVFMYPFSHYQVPVWMDPHMSSYPPPPQPDQQHYNPLQYPTAAGAQQLLDPVQQEQLAFNQLNQPIYPKLEPEPPIDPNAASQVEQRLEQRLEQQLQQHNPLPPHPPHQGALPQPPPQQHGAPQDQTPKTNRLRKACDSCSIRKVKCDESGPPCRACAALDIPCTFERPSRRRGPPNRHAEAIKRRRLESPHMSGASAPSSPTHAAQALAALSAHPANQQTLSAESICPVETLDLLINDFFTYIHPLCPFPHEPSFREAWKRREDYTNRPFLALLASMIAALVASFPRKPRLHLKAQRKENMFPNHLSLVQKCQKVCSAARGPGYLESDDLNVHDAATSYFLGLSRTYTFRWRQGRIYFGECMSILRSLGLDKPTENTYNHLGRLPEALGSHGPDFEGSRDETRDYITLEMGRRIFWTMFVSFKSIQQCGVTLYESFFPPETPSNPYPPLPVEVDDFCIFPTHIEPQPPGMVPSIVGFNANVRVFASYDPLWKMEVSWGIDSIVDWDRQKQVLHETLRRCKSSISSLPQELMVWPHTSPFGGPGSDQNGHPTSGSESYPQFQPYMPHNDPAMLNIHEEPSPEERRRLQYEIQKANIYASSLCTRSYLVEKYWNLCEAHNRRRAANSANSTGSAPSSPGIMGAGLDGLLQNSGHAPHNLGPTSGAFEAIEREMCDEREAIIKDLLIVLGSINQVNMEPNGDSFTMKIRSVASTLLDVPKQRKGSVAQQAEQYLAAFLDMLMKLERAGPAHNDPERPEDEEAELRQWADLREYQMKFAQQGGILGMW